MGKDKKDKKKKLEEKKPPIDENQLRKDKRDKRKLLATAASAEQKKKDAAEEPKEFEEKTQEDIRIGGIEGGATHSTLMLVDGNGKKLKEIKGPGTNHWQLGIQETASRINGMICKVKRELHIPPLDCVGLSLSGCEQEETNRLLAETLLKEYPKAAKAYVVESDTMGSVKTGLENGGIVLIAGTGSNALLVNPDGKTYGCGGWGHMMGDEGSAYWIAHRACKYVFDDLDNLKKSPSPISYVWPAMRNYFHVAERNDLLPHLYANFNKSKFAMFTKELVIGCEHGDPLCLLIFEETGRILAKHTHALQDKAHNDLKLSKGGIKVICVGSVWKSWKFMKKGFTDEIHHGFGINELSLMRLTTSAAMGSCYLAADHIKCGSVKKEYEKNVDIFYHYKRENTPKDDVKEEAKECDQKFCGSCEAKCIEPPFLVEDFQLVDEKNEDEAKKLDPEEKNGDEKKPD